MPGTTLADPFRTAELRAGVLAAWAASPTRFREDANTEEDLRLDGYADAWLVELAQNAADAARAAGRPGRLAVDLVAGEAPGGELRVANTGAPLDAAGVAALAALRASAKRDDAASVGRFGIGFTAVLALTDAPRLLGTDGGVAFSAARTAAEVATLPGPAAELARRDEPPVLRLCWPTAEPPRAGFDTEVRLPLRPGVDGAALLAQARADASDLLLVLPDLVEIDVAGTVVRRSEEAGGQVRVGDRRWRLARRTGTLAAPDAAAQATEQRSRRTWTLCWALPLTADGAPDPLPADVLHAPTATAERLGLPARLIAPLPLEPDRRRVRPGPAADAMLAAAGPAYLDLVRATPPEQRIALVPPPGFPRSELDDRLRGLLRDALRGAAWLPGVHPGAHPGAELAPGRAEWLDLPDAAPELPGLLAVAGFDRLLAVPDPAAVAAALSELGVHRLTPGELVDRLLSVAAPAAWWHRLYAALAPAVDAVPGLAGELAALPVPLSDGRLVPGPAGVLLPAPDAGPADPVAELAALGLTGLHVADPAAAHPLLSRLGAAVAQPAALLAHPALVAAVDRSLDDAEAGLDPAPLAAAVLDLVAAAPAEAGPGLGGLALPAVDGDPARADELVLPDAALRPLLAPDTPLAVLDPGWAARFPRSALTAVGVLDGFAVLDEDDPAGPDHDLDDEERWWDGLPEPPRRLLAVRDLDLVDPDAWPAALAVLAGDRDTHAAVTLPGGYTGWWLARHARLSGHRPGHYRLRSADGLGALYDPVPDTAADEALLVAAGVRAELVVADAPAAADLLARLADPRRHPDPALVAAAHAALADAVLAGRVAVDDLDPPERVRASDGAVRDVDRVVVLDAPWPAAVLPAAELVFGGDPVALAELLDLPLATEVIAATVDGAGEPVRWAELPEVVLACQQLAVPVPAGGPLRHDQLWVRVTRPVEGRFQVPVWRDDAGRWHAADPVRALLAVLADAST